jgi:hypothetical protein
MSEKIRRKDDWKGRSNQLQTTVKSMKMCVEAAPNDETGQTGWGPIVAERAQIPARHGKVTELAARVPKPIARRHFLSP